MTVGWAPANISAAAVLFPHGNAREVLHTELGRQRLAGEVFRTVRHLSDAGRAELWRRFSDAVMEILDLDVIVLVVRTFQTYGDLIAAAERTVAMPASVEIVQLFTVPVPWTTNATVELLVDGTPRLTIRFELSVVLGISVEAVVKGGRLIAVQNGQCTVTVTLNVDGVPVATNATMLDLAVYLPIGSGIPLTRAHGRV